MIPLATQSALQSAPAESLVERLRQRQPILGAEALHDAVDTDVADDLGAWGWLRGVKERAVMLELRLRSGNVVAFSYAYLERVMFDPSEGITLQIAGAKPIVIRGRRLNDELRPQVRLFEGIVRHRVAWVREGDLAKVSHDAPTIDQIIL